MEAEQGTTVELYIYDLTNGLASLLSPTILGQQIEGVWHTAIVAYQREFFFGGEGITSCAPGSTQLGAPHRVERLGETFVPFQVFVDYIQGLATTSYTPTAYNLLEHNCNHFSEEVAQFLCGAHIPKHIVAQPEMLTPHARAAIQALLDNLLPRAAQQTMYSNGGMRQNRQDSPEFVTLNSQIEEASAADSVDHKLWLIGAATRTRRTWCWRECATRARWRRPRCAFSAHTDCLLNRRLPRNDPADFIHHRSVVTYSFTHIGSFHSYFDGTDQFVEDRHVFA